MLHEAAEAGLALTQGPLRVIPFGDVLDRAGLADDVSGFVHHRFDLFMDHANRAIRQHDAVGHLEGYGLVLIGFENRDGGVAIVGMDPLPPLLRRPVGHAVRVTEDAQPFLRPAQAVQLRNPFPRSQLGDPLRAVQPRFAFAQGPLGLPMVFDCAPEPRGGQDRVRRQRGEEESAHEPGDRQPGMSAARRHPAGQIVERAVFDGADEEESRDRQQRADDCDRDRRQSRALRPQGAQDRGSGHGRRPSGLSTHRPIMGSVHRSHSASRELGIVVDSDLARAPGIATAPKLLTIQRPLSPQRIKRRLRFENR